jgi:hypothetical protein
MMAIEFLELKKYLRDTIDAEIAPVPWRGTNALPMFLQERYKFLEIRLLEIPCLLMVDQQEQEQTPAIIRKHMDQVQLNWHGEVIYLRTRITAYNRKRLINHKIPFIVPGNQMYLPMKGIDLREHYKKLRNEIHKFAPSTQVLVIHMLLNRTLQGFSPSEIAGRLGYSNMTMTRAFNELESADIGFYNLPGRDRTLAFQGNEMDLWAKLQGFLQDPVKKRLQVEPLNFDVHAPVAGFTALAHYTMLAKPKNHVIAMTGKKWNQIKHKHVKEIPGNSPGPIEIEIWSYNPDLFAKNNVVDRLSLYLSLKGNQDERTESALEEIMKGFKW